MTQAVKPDLKTQLTVAADLLEEHGAPPEVLSFLRGWRPPDTSAKLDPLNCFRLAIRDLPFGKMGGEILGLQLRVDARMIEFGLMRSGGDPVRMNQQIRYIAQDLAAQVEAALLKEIARLGN